MASGAEGQAGLPHLLTLPRLDRGKLFHRTKEDRPVRPGEGGRRGVTTKKDGRVKPGHDEFRYECAASVHLLAGVDTPQLGLLHETVIAAGA